MKNMKTRLILFILLFISGFAIAGCKQQNQYRPDAKIVAAFNNKYPQSDKVEWEQKQGYYVAEFREDGIEHEAWFDGTGKWPAVFFVMACRGTKCLPRDEMPAER